MKKYFWKSIKKDRRNFYSSIAVFFFLFSSLQILFAFSANLANSIFFYSAGYQDDCYYRDNPSYFNQNIDWNHQGLLKQDFTTETIGDDIFYTVECTEPCLTNNLGFLLSQRVLIQADQPTDKLSFPKTPYAILLGDLNNEKTSFEKNGIVFQVAHRLNLKDNKPILKKIQSMGFKRYGLVALIDPQKPVDYFSGTSNLIIRPSPEEMEFLLPDCISGKQLNEEIRMGRATLPSGMYVIFLIPFLAEAIIVFSFLTTLQRKTRGEIFALRLISASRWQCGSLLFGRRFFEYLIGFLLSALCFLPWIIPLTSTMPYLWLIGEGVCLFYVLIILFFRTIIEVKKAFYPHAIKQEALHD